MRLWVVIAAAAVVAAFVFGGKLVHRGADSAGTEVVSLAQGVPSEAGAAVAEANVQSALTAVQTYFADHGTYAGLTAAALRRYDRSLSPTLVVVPTAAGVCVQDTVHGATASGSPGGAVPPAACR